MAGITITYVMGENSVFKQAQKSKLEYNIAKAREQLEVALGQAKIFKHTDKKYNQDEYLDELMKKEIPNIKIADDIVIVDGYAFEIDRSEPKIGKYVGEEKDLVFPEITVSVALADDSKTATIHITAKEEKNGISKIEIIQEGYVLETYECENTKEEVIKDYIAKQNGVYTIKVYAGLTARKKATVEGLIASVKYSPNGNEEWKKEHQVKVSVAEDIEKVKSIKYQWLQTTAEPAESSFTTVCANGETITGESYTGTYYLWTLLETESGKKNIGRSEGFNFDNEGPTVTLTSTPVSATSFTLNVTATDNYSDIAKYEFYVNGETEPRHSIETTDGTVSYTMTGVDTGNTSCNVIVIDRLGNETKKTITATTKLYVWERWSCNATSYWSAEGWKSVTNVRVCSAYYISVYNKYSVDTNSGWWCDGTTTSRVEELPFRYLDDYNSLGNRTRCAFFNNCWVISTNKGTFAPQNLYRGYSYRCEGEYYYFNAQKNHTIKNTNYSKGTTKYPDITGTSTTAYPTNGHQSGSWYVYKGIQ